MRVSEAIRLGSMVTEKCRYALTGGAMGRHARAVLRNRSRAFRVRQIQVRAGMPDCSFAWSAFGYPTGRIRKSLVQGSFGH